MWTDGCVCVCEDSGERFGGKMWQECRRGEEGRGLKRMKFQIPLTVLDSWPGMHTSPGLGRAWGFGIVI